MSHALLEEWLKVLLLNFLAEETLLLKWKGDTLKLELRSRLEYLKIRDGFQE